MKYAYDWGTAALNAVSAATRRAVHALNAHSFAARDVSGGYRYQDARDADVMLRRSTLRNSLRIRETYVTARNWFTLSDARMHEAGANDSPRFK